jgi:hypothetical protein
MTPLTPEQQRLLGQSKEPPRLFDPDSRQEYVLIPVELYDRLRDLLGDNDPRELYPLLHRALRDEGWDDPRMDEYD